MIPLNDASRRPVNFPIVTTLIIIVNVVVFGLEVAGGDAFVIQWSLVPANIAAGKGLITFLISMFMHAGLMHIAGNMMFLWAFGPEIEDVMGRGRYLVFYLLAGCAATFAQVVAAPASTVPNLGASGAIAGVMGAFLVTFPRDRIRTILLLGWFTRVAFIPAIVLVGIWFLIQLFNGVGALSDVQSQTGGVAYMAHVGGFIFGAVFARLFERPERIAEQKQRVQYT